MASLDSRCRYAWHFMPLTDWQMVALCRQVWTRGTRCLAAAKLVSRLPFWARWMDSGIEHSWRASTKTRMSLKCCWLTSVARRRCSVCDFCSTTWWRLLSHCCVCTLSSTTDLVIYLRNDLCFAVCRLERSKAQIPLGSLRHVLNRHDTFDVSSQSSSSSSHAVRQARHSQNAWAQHIKRVVSRCDVTSQVELRLKPLQICL